jgi:hypothetical protein
VSASPGTDPPDSIVRTHRGQSPIWALALWYPAAFALVLLLPTLWRLGQPFWLLPPPQVQQVLVWGAAFLALALLALLAAGRDRVRTAVTTLIATPLIWVSGYLLLTTLPDVQVSRVVAVSTGVLSVALVLIPLLRETWVRGGAVLLALLAVGSLILARATAATAPAESTALRAALHPIQFTFLREVVGTGGTDGGAVAALGDGFLHVNGAGEFSRLDWDSTGTMLLARRVPLTPPLDRRDSSPPSPTQARCTASGSPTCCSAPRRRPGRSWSPTPRGTRRTSASRSGSLAPSCSSICRRGTIRPSGRSCSRPLRVTPSA